jgi:hypothetical protein
VRFHIAGAERERPDAEKEPGCRGENCAKELGAESDLLLWFLITNAGNHSSTGNSFRRAETMYFAEETFGRATGRGGDHPPPRSADKQTTGGLSQRPELKRKRAVMASEIKKGLIPLGEDPD